MPIVELCLWLAAISLLISTMRLLRENRRLWLELRKLSGVPHESE